MPGAGFQAEVRADPAESLSANSGDEARTRAPTPERAGSPAQTLSIESDVFPAGSQDTQVMDLDDEKSCDSFGLSPPESVSQWGNEPLDDWSSSYSSQDDDEVSDHGDMADDSVAPGADSDAHMSEEPEPVQPEKPSHVPGAVYQDITGYTMGPMSQTERARARETALGLPGIGSKLGGDVDVDDEVLFASAHNHVRDVVLGSAKASYHKGVSLDEIRATARSFADSLGTPEGYISNLMGMVDAQIKAQQKRTIEHANRRVTGAAADSEPGKATAVVPQVAEATRDQIQVRGCSVALKRMSVPEKELATPEQDARRRAFVAGLTPGDARLRDAITAEVKWSDPVTPAVFAQGGLSMGQSVIGPSGLARFNRCRRYVAGSDEWERAIYESIPPHGQQGPDNPSQYRHGFSPAECKKHRQLVARESSDLGACYMSQLTKWDGDLAGPFHTPNQNRLFNLVKDARILQFNLNWVRLKKDNRGRTEAEFVCPYESCSVFRRFRETRDHILKAHLNTNPVQCSYCPRAYPADDCGRQAYAIHLALDHHESAQEDVGPDGLRLAQEWPYRECTRPNGVRLTSCDVEAFMRAVYVKLFVRDLLSSEVGHLRRMQYVFKSALLAVRPDLRGSQFLPEDSQSFTVVLNKYERVRSGRKARLRIQRADRPTSTSSAGDCSSASARGRGRGRPESRGGTRGRRSSSGCGDQSKGVKRARAAGSPAPPVTTKSGGNPGSKPGKVATSTVRGQPAASATGAGTSTEAELGTTRTLLGHLRETLSAQETSRSGEPTQATRALRVAESEMAAKEQRLLQALSREEARTAAEMQAHSPLMGPHPKVARNASPLSEAPASVGAPPSPSSDVVMSSPELSRSQRRRLHRKARKASQADAAGESTQASQGSEGDATTPTTLAVVSSPYSAAVTGLPKPVRPPVPTVQVPTSQGVVTRTEPPATSGDMVVLGRTTATQVKVTTSTGTGTSAVHTEVPSCVAQVTAATVQAPVSQPSGVAPGPAQAQVTSIWGPTTLTPVVSSQVSAPGTSALAPPPGLGRPPCVMTSFQTPRARTTAISQGPATPGEAATINSRLTRLGLRGAHVQPGTTMGPSDNVTGIPVARTVAGNLIRANQMFAQEADAYQAMFPYPEQLGETVRHFTELHESRAVHGDSAPFHLQRPQVRAVNRGSFIMMPGTNQEAPTFFQVVTPVMVVTQGPIEPHMLAAEDRARLYDRLGPGPDQSFERAQDVLAWYRMFGREPDYMYVERSLEALGRFPGPRLPLHNPVVQFPGGITPLRPFAGQTRSRYPPPQPQPRSPGGDGASNAPSTMDALN